MQLMISDIGRGNAARCVLVPVCILVFVSSATHGIEALGYKISIGLARYLFKSILQWNGLFYCPLHFATAVGLELFN